MNNLNSILIEGNMVRDPELRSTPKGTPVCVFSLASNRFYKQDSKYEKEVSFFEVESWAKLAESCHIHGHKGRGVRVVGRLKQDRWNGSDGKQKSRVSIVAEHVEFRPEFTAESISYTGAGVTKATAQAASRSPGGKAAKPDRAAKLAEAAALDEEDGALEDGEIDEAFPELEDSYEGVAF